MYFVCLLKALSYTIEADPGEIAACQWFPLKDVAEDDSQPALVRRATQLASAALNDDSFILTEERLRSIYKKRWFTLYHQPLAKLKNYRGHFVDMK